MDLILRFAMRQGFRRFRDGDHFAWAVLAACAYLLRRAIRADPPTTLLMRRGESFVISPADSPVPQN